MITLAVQAGGRSSRMGRDKALLPLGGIPLIEHVLRRTAGLAEEVLITTNRPADLVYLGVRLVADREPGAGALPGLLTALEAAHGETVLLLACDLPFVCRPLLEHLLSLAHEAQVVVPQWKDNLEPLHAVYSNSCANAVRAAMQAGQPRVIDLLPRVTQRVVAEAEIAQFDPDGSSFFNVNTPQDL
ncbi:MAG TPA: molybdenum cofactor guanylyltransferase, partial [Anaerolineales bacterium]|nr:molybdenum cofactor guanylyltransferase [Anaerolineales bacterium]